MDKRLIGSLVAPKTSAHAPFGSVTPLSIVHCRPRTVCRCHQVVWMHTHPTESLPCSLSPPLKRQSSIAPSLPLPHLSLLPISRLRALPIIILHHPPSPTYHPSSSSCFILPIITLNSQLLLFSSPLRASTSQTTARNRRHLALTSTTRKLASTMSSRFVFPVAWMDDATLATAACDTVAAIVCYGDTKTTNRGRKSRTG